MNPKKYEVSKTTDSDFCDKVINLIQRIPRNLYVFTFRHLTRLGTSPMECLVLDAVVLRTLLTVSEQYLLNREPREIEYLRCLVDGLALDWS